jgi:hypothetical protein
MIIISFFLHLFELFSTTLVRFFTLCEFTFQSSDLFFTTTVRFDSGITLSFQLRNLVAASSVFLLCSCESVFTTTVGLNCFVSCCL